MALHSRYREKGAVSYFKRTGKIQRLYVKGRGPGPALKEGN